MWLPISETKRDMNQEPDETQTMPHGQLVGSPYNDQATMQVMRISLKLAM